ncbi:GNAT family N-acetyltransferase [Candidatus Woesearchaeota archaeon]|nr:GNAT family N-acetyltransferase [Candidatus Woesearchaeota archaeon]
MLKSNRLVLRHFKKDDAKDYLKAHDKVAARNFRRVPKNLRESKAEVDEHIEQYSVPVNKRKEEAFVIEIDEEFCGWINVHDIRYGHKAVTASLVDKKYRGKGIGTEAHKLLLPYAFKKYKLVRISGRLRAFNKASAKMLEKSGYRYEGTHRKDYKKNGRYYDHLVYAVVR